MHTHHERGIALVLALFLMSALSVLGASLMFLSQTETYASMNYRMMSQARYAGEAGVQKAANFLLDSAQYAIPSGAAALAQFDRTQSPVRCLSGCTTNGPVVLSATSAVASNYPVGTVQTAFNAAAQGTLTAGNASISYKAHATLLSMQVFDSYGGGQSTVQTWEITGDGSLTGGRNATVEVVAIVETPKVAANSYAAFATANTCGAIYFHGNVTVDSYDSSVPGGLAASLETSGGDVGTNGNLEIQGHVVVEGNLYSPRTGVGTCTAGAVNALSGAVADVTGSIVQLPTAVSYPLPTFSVTPPTTAVTVNAASLGTTAVTAALACAQLGLTYGDNTGQPGHPAGNCDLKTATGLSALAGTTGTQFTNVVVSGYGTDVTLPSVTVSSGYKMTFTGNSVPAQNVNINSLAGGGEVDIDANLATNTNQSVVLKVAGKNPPGVLSTLPDPTDMDPPFDLSLMSWKQNSATSSYDASALQIVYPGTGAISMKGGNSQSAASIYAPNATFSLQGTQDLYGSILAKTITNGGNANIHYDRRLSHDFYVAGHPMVGTFTWKRY